MYPLLNGAFNLIQMVVFVQVSLEWFVILVFCVIIAMQSLQACVPRSESRSRLFPRPVGVRLSSIEERSEDRHSRTD